MGVFFFLVEDGMVLTVEALSRYGAGVEDGMLRWVEERMVWRMSEIRFMLLLCLAMSCLLSYDTNH